MPPAPIASRECCTATVDGNDAGHVTGPIYLVTHLQAASVCDLDAQACAQLEVISPSDVCRGSTSGGQVKLSRKNDPGAEPARSHTAAARKAQARALYSP